MIIKDVKPTVQSSSSFQESYFSISDLGMVFDILRNKLYSNPIGAICREITCNARDTHRAIGKFNEPIHVHLPNALEPFLKIKDFGEGISPDRMENIYIKYAASTKRGDNVQTGAFGAGAKVPFSYSDTFIIVTIFDGVKYNYSAFIDETKVGKMALLSSEPTNESNGTEIIIPVKEKDFKKFYSEMRIATQHWDIKPIFTGVDDFKYPGEIEFASGKNWKVVYKNREDYKNCNNIFYTNGMPDVNSYYEMVKSYNKFANIIIDGIEYPLNDFMGNKNVKKFFGSLNGLIVNYYFNNGELSLSANRESIQFDDDTIKKLCKVIIDSQNELAESLQKQFDACENLWQANVIYNEKISRATTIPLKWKNYKIGNSLNQKLLLKVFEHSWYSGYYTDQIQSFECYAYNVSISSHSKIFINDFAKGMVNLKGVAKQLLNKSSDLKVIYIIDPKGEDIDTFIQKNDLEPWGFEKLSSLGLQAVESKKSTTKTPVNLFKFEKASHKFTKCAYESAKAITNKKVLCEIKKENGYNDWSIVLNGTTIDATSLNFFTDASFFGIKNFTKENISKAEFKDFQLFDEYVKELKDSGCVDFVGSKYALMKHQKYDNDIIIAQQIQKFDRSFDDKSLFNVSLSKLDKVLALLNNLGAVGAYELVNGPIDNKQIKEWKLKNPDMVIGKIMSDIYYKYPIISTIPKHTDTKHYNKYVDYIKLIDKQG